MRMNLAGFATVAVFLCLSSGFLGAGASGGPWKPGRVTSIGINAQGAVSQAKGAGARGNDIWWNYVVSSKDADYAVLSRESPARAGIRKDGDIRFQEGRNQIYILDPSGKRIALKILRKDKRRP